MWRKEVGLRFISTYTFNQNSNSTSLKNTFERCVGIRDLIFIPAHQKGAFHLGRETGRDFVRPGRPQHAIPLAEFRKDVRENDSILNFHFPAQEPNNLHEEILVIFAPCD